MVSINKVILIGDVGRVPGISYLEYAQLVLRRSSVSQPVWNCADFWGQDFFKATASVAGEVPKALISLLVALLSSIQSLFSPSDRPTDVLGSAAACAGSATKRVGGFFGSTKANKRNAP